MDDIVIKLEHDIASFISKDNGATVHFNYKTDSNGWVVYAFTVNAESKEVFLLKSAKNFVKKDALEEILEYVKTQKGLNPFTVIWAKAGSTKTETSYFHCHDVVDVVKKFFEKKEVANYVVYSIKLNPSS